MSTAVSALRLQLAVSDTPLPDLAALVADADTGDPQAREARFATPYDELHRLALLEVRRQGDDSPLSATTLLHEVYLAFGETSADAFPDRAHLLAYAARAMRGVLIDRLRARQAHKRGGGLRAMTLESGHAQDVNDPEALFALHHPLETLEGVDATLAGVVDLKFFGGFTFGEIAAVHGVSERTVQRQWDKARLLLRAMLRDASDTSP